MNPVALVMLGVGALMVWSGVTNRDPITVVKDVLQGKGVPTGGSGINRQYGSADAAERQAPGGNPATGSGTSGTGGPNIRI